MIRIIFEDETLKSHEDLEFLMESQDESEKDVVLNDCKRFLKKQENRDKIAKWLLFGEAEIKCIDSTGYCLVKGLIKGDVFSGKFSYELRES